MRIRIVLWLPLIIAAIFHTPAGANVYGYVDKDGVYHFTNIPNDPRYKLWFRSPDRYASEYDVRRAEPHIRKASETFGVDASLIKAVIKVESNFNARAVSAVGAMGIMQLMPDTASRMKVADVFDAEANIVGGTRHLRDLLYKFNGNLNLALAAYNIGERTVQRYRGIPPVKQTQDYVKRVRHWYKTYRKSDGQGVSRPDRNEVRI